MSRVMFMMCMLMSLSCSESIDDNSVLDISGWVDPDNHVDFITHKTIDPIVAIILGADPGAKSYNRDCYLQSVLLSEKYPDRPGSWWVRHQFARQVYHVHDALDSCNTLLKLTNAPKAVEVCKASEYQLNEEAPVKMREMWRRQQTDHRTIAHTWVPLVGIEGYRIPDTIRSETTALQKAWLKYKFSVNEGNRFDFRNVAVLLSRKWGYHVGEIEGLYDLPPSFTRSLIVFSFELRHVMDSADIKKYITDAPTELDSVRAVNGIFVDQARVMMNIYHQIETQEVGINITRQLLLDVHNALTASFPFHRIPISKDTLGSVHIMPGHFKYFLNSPTLPGSQPQIHQYSPPWKVEEEIERLVSLMDIYSSNGNMDPIVKAAWLHHVFVATHPFADGNGRTARAITSIVLIKNGLLPLVVTKGNKHDYIEALKAANGGGLERLVVFIQQCQEETMKWIIDNPPDPLHTSTSVPYRGFPPDKDEI